MWSINLIYFQTWIWSFFRLKVVPFVGPKQELPLQTRQFLHLEDSGLDVRCRETINSHFFCGVFNSCFNNILIFFLKKHSIVKVHQFGLIFADDQPPMWRLKAPRGSLLAMKSQPANFVGAERLRGPLESCSIDIYTYRQVDMLCFHYIYIYMYIMIASIYHFHIHGMKQSSFQRVLHHGFYAERSPETNLLCKVQLQKMRWFQPPLCLAAIWGMVHL